MSNVIYLSLFLLIIIAVAIIYKKNKSHKTENFVSAQQVGGTVATKMDLNSYSTIVRKLSGNNGKTIILIHNSPFDLQVWYSLYMYTQGLLKENKTIPTLISYDLKGHGTAWLPVATEYNDADPNNIAWTIQEFSNDLYSIYQKYVGDGKVTVAGFGFGANVAQEFALKHPETIDHLFILAQSLQGPTSGALDRENQYLVNWITQNQNVSYLTLAQSFVQLGMCAWFQNKSTLICPYPENQHDTIDTYQTVEYLLANKMYREANAATFLQVNKILDLNDFTPQWEKAMVDFSITMLVANLDKYVSTDLVRDDTKTLKMASKNVQTYIVEGKHGFVLLQPEYIYKLLDGEDMSADSLTVETIS